MRTPSLFLFLLLAPLAAQPVSWIVDTDAGSDDHMAVAYLLAKPGIRVEAITSVNGLAHAGPGARNMKRLVELAGQPAIPVFAGADRPLVNTAEFPAEWRKASDELPGVALPPLRGAVESTEAVGWLARRLARPARILALGPLTNLARVLQQNPALARNIQELVIMGGAIHAAGNLQDGGHYRTENALAEWNLFIDPQAADAVFRAVRTIKLVPLDATNRVPFRLKHLSEFEQFARGPLGTFMTQVLKMDEPFIREGIMYAWDPLAAAAVGAPALLSFQPAAVQISLKKDEEGRTTPIFQGTPNIQAALGANADAFHAELYNAFAAPADRKIYDLLIQGGHVMDPRNGIDRRMDVAIAAGKIAAVEPSIPAWRAARVVRAEGLYVTPGLIDIHVHVFASTGKKGVYNGDNSVYPDGHTFRAGTTTVVDCGSAGADEFASFREHVINRSKTRVLAWLNIVRGGMTDALEQDVRLMDAALAAATARKHRDVIIGIKTAHFQGPAWTPVDRALEAGRLAGLPIMVDFGIFRPERPFSELVTRKLRPGDIYTHFFLERVPMLDGQGRVRPFFAEARQRGVLFDTGHGGGSFVWRHAVPATQQGLWPDSISTDLHISSMLGGMKDMLNVMSKFLALGMPLPEVIQKSTWNPARQIHREELGHLTAGAVADVAVLGVERGSFGFVDVDGKRRKGDRKLTGELTIRAGQIVWDLNGIAADDSDER